MALPTRPSFPQGSTVKGQFVGNAGRQRAARADAAARKLAPVIAELERQLIIGTRVIADELNRRGYRRARNGLWTSVEVNRLLKRMIAGGYFTTRFPVSERRAYSPPLHPEDVRRGVESSRQAHRDAADDFALSIAPIISSLRVAGITTFEALAHELNQRGILTRQGKAWTYKRVTDVLARVADIQARSTASDITATQVPQK